MYHFNYIKLRHINFEFYFFLYIVKLNFYLKIIKPIKISNHTIQLRFDVLKNFIIFFFFLNIFEKKYKF